MFERPMTVLALDRSAIETGSLTGIHSNKLCALRVTKRKLGYTFMLALQGMSISTGNILSSIAFHSFVPTIPSCFTTNSE